ncbi:MAG: hypothetical protein ACTSO2_19525 [Promethearchaeota archaeon]
MTEEKLSSKIIAIPIKVKLSRIIYGYFLGPCYMYYAEALNLITSANSAEQAIERLTTKLKEKFSGIGDF